MGLSPRINFNDKDYVYQIINSKLINQNTTELELLLDGETIIISKNDKQIWVLNNEGIVIDPNLFNL